MMHDITGSYNNFAALSLLLDRRPSVALRYADCLHEEQFPGDTWDPEKSGGHFGDSERAIRPEIGGAETGPERPLLLY
jgi:hypothetical protein